jgi:16S rRNA (uracil1498-N3)-methyltransferase
MNTTPRLFIPGPLADGAELQASPAQAHHLGTVLRHAQGDALRVFNGADGEFAATMTQLRKSSLTLTLGHQIRPQSPEPDCWLVCALLKRDATDLVVQKATELGVSAIHPVLTERTNAARVNLERLQSIATEAAIQCERLTIPSVAEPQPLMNLLGAWPGNRTLTAAVERATAPGIVAGARCNPAALLIGPEGGFTSRELDVLASTPFIQAVSLGPRILRADTAAIAGLALLLAHPL